MSMLSAIMGLHKTALLGLTSILVLIIVLTGIQTLIEIYYLTILEWVFFVIFSGRMCISFRTKENAQIKKEIFRLKNRPDQQCSLCDDRKHLQNELAASRNMIQDFLGKNFKCNICQDILLDGVETSCKHRYCGGCLKRWRWEMDNCPLCRVEFEEEEEPTSLNSVNKNIDHIFDAMPSLIKQERQNKRQDFLRMKRPTPREPTQTRRFSNLDDFLQFVVSNNGAVTRNGDGSVRVTLPQNYNN